MKRVLWLLMIISSVTYAQEQKSGEFNDTTGIQFAKGLSFQEILSMAKTEKKYIFVDCYASWCAPCKLMERDVFRRKAVGDFMNSHFISLKVQMDTSKEDNEYIKSWYDDAHKMNEQYKV